MGLTFPGWPHSSYPEARDAPVRIRPGRGTHRAYQVPLEERGRGAFVLCLTSHQRTVDANVSRIFHSSVSICSPHFRRVGTSGMLTQKHRHSACSLFGGPFPCACRPAIPNLALSSARKPAVRSVGGLAHVRNRKPTRVVSEVEGCENWGLGGSPGPGTNTHPDRKRTCG